MQTIILQFLTGMQITSLKLRPTICDRFAKRGSCTCTISRHTFHPHLLVTSVNQQLMCLILLKVEQSTFTQASFSSLSDIHVCSAGLQMAQSSLGKKTAYCESPHDWLMSLSMDLTALCDIWR